jgi:predicted RNA polymerase sigma factor
VAEDPSLRGYAQVPAVRAHLLGQLGRVEEARDAYRLAADLTENAAEAALLRRRADAL